MAAHIVDFFEANEILSEKQFGFRKGRGTDDQLLLVYSEVVRGVDDGKVVDVVYLDFSKAFDLVSHRILLDKLLLLGFDRFVVGWIEDFLVGRRMSVSVSGQLGSSFEVTSGVPQGSVLGPLLFLIYVNFITKDLVGSWAAFADDFKLSVCYAKNDSEDRDQSINRLQADIDSIARVSSSWSLKLNPAKCVVMRFGERLHEARVLDYQISGETLRFVEVYRDLGVVVDSSLRFHRHVDIVVGKAGSMISNLLRSTVCRSVEFMLTLWVTHVRSIIEYGSCVWNVGYLRDIRRLESLQRRWTREIQGMGSLDYVSRLRSLGLFSIKGRLLRMDLIKVWKCFHMEVDLGLSGVFELARDVGTRGHAYKLSIPVCRSELGRRTFGVRVVRKWNSLPPYFCIYLIILA